MRPGNKPKGSTARIVTDNVVVNVGKRDIQDAIVPAVTVCQKMCRKDKFPCQVGDSKFFLSIDDTNGSFWSGTDFTEDEVVTDEETAVIAWTGNGFPKGGMLFNGEFTSNFFYLPVDESTVGAWYRDGNALRKNQPIENSVDTVLAYAAETRTFKEAVTYICVVDRLQRFNGYLFRFSISFGDTICYVTVGASGISYKRETDSVVVPVVPPTDTIVYGYNDPNKLVIMISCNQSGLINLTVNGLQRRIKHSEPLNDNYTFFTQTITSDEMPEDVNFIIRELHGFDGNITKKIKDFYNSLLEKYEVNTEYLPSSYLYSRTPLEKDQTIDFVNDTDDIYFYYLNENTPNLSYNHTDSGESGYGNIFYQLSSCSKEAIYIDNITFSPEAPSELKNKLRCLEVTDPDINVSDDDSIVTFTEFPYILRQDTTWIDNTTSKVYYILCTSQEVFDYEGTIIIHLRRGGTTELLELPLSYEVT
jgi:hypothetical protein